MYLGPEYIEIVLARMPHIWNVIYEDCYCRIVNVDAVSSWCSELKMLKVVHKLQLDSTVMIEMLGLDMKIQNNSTAPITYCFAVRCTGEVCDVDTVALYETKTDSDKSRLIISFVERIGNDLISSHGSGTILIDSWAYNAMLDDAAVIGKRFLDVISFLKKHDVCIVDNLCYFRCMW